MKWKGQVPPRVCSCCALCVPVCALFIPSFPFSIRLLHFHLVFGSFGRLNQWHHFVSIRCSNFDWMRDVAYARIYRIEWSRYTQWHAERWRYETHQAYSHYIHILGKYFRIRVHVYEQILWIYIVCETSDGTTEKHPRILLQIHTIPTTYYYCSTRKYMILGARTRGQNGRGQKTMTMVVADAISE